MVVEPGIGDPDRGICLQLLDTGREERGLQPIIGIQTGDVFDLGLPRDLNSSVAGNRHALVVLAQIADASVLGLPILDHLGRRPIVGGSIVHDDDMGEERIVLLDRRS
jgi:hypothetical protein